MSTINDGGPAFPIQYSNERDGPTVMPSAGMTLRDKFAEATLIGFLAGLSPDAPYIEDAVARRCYAMADAMLAERAKGQA